MKIEFVYSRMRVIESTGGSSQKENRDREVERTEVVSGPGEGLKVQQLSFHPCSTVDGRHTVGAQLIYLRNWISQ